MKTITNLNTVDELDNITLYNFNVSKTNEDDNVWFIEHEHEQEMITFSIAPQNAETIYFTIPKGYTWEQFVNSEYNTSQNYYSGESTFTTKLEIECNESNECRVAYQIFESDNDTYARIYTSDYDSVNIYDEILENTEYISEWPPQ